MAYETCTIQRHQAAKGRIHKKYRQACRIHEALYLADNHLPYIYDRSHDLFGMVLQDTWMFEGTLRENIVYSKQADDEQVRAACEAAGITHYISTQPGGLEHYVENGDEISGGQKQLITIARAMIENAPMLILDEATSNVDTRTEEIIQTAMDNLTRGRTSFVIAHRLSTIKNADLILVMRDGNIVEQGKHEELLAQNGFYASLYNSQFAGE